MNKEETIIKFKNETGLGISNDVDITTGKIVINDIEITSIEDWNKVTKSLIELQQENKELHNKIDKAIEYIEKYKQIYDIDGSVEKQIDEFCVLASPKKLLEILGSGVYDNGNMERH